MNPCIILLNKQGSLSNTLFLIKKTPTVESVILIKFINLLIILIFSDFISWKLVVSQQPNVKLEVSVGDYGGLIESPLWN